MILGTTSPIVSSKALCLVVGVCVVAAFYFVPDQTELVSRLDKDGHVDRLRALAKEALEDQSAAQPATAPQTDAERMFAWLTNPDVAVRTDPAVVAEKKIMCAITDTPGEVGLILVAGSGWMDVDEFSTYIEALARRALGMQRPAEAGYLLTELNKRAPSWECTMRAVQAWRWGVKSDEALKALNLAPALGLKTQDCPESFDNLRIKLALESNQPNVAFTIVLEKYKTAAAADRPKLLHRLLELANAGDHTADAGKLIAEHLATVPYQLASLDEAIQMAESGKAFPSATAERDYREYATSLAHWQEWANHGDKAIDLWFHLAVLGSDEAWARVQDLYEDVLRNEDFVRLLGFRISKGLSYEKEPLLADMLVDAGRVDEAVEHYKTAINRQANPLPLHRSLARIYQQMGRWQESADAFAKVLETHPGDAEAGKGCAFAWVRMHKYEEARVKYVELAHAHPDDAELQETCAGLCDSLGFNDEAREANIRLLAIANRMTTPEDHLELADQCRLAGDVDGSIRALRTGFERNPASTRLRMTLAEALAQKGNHDEAVQLLAHESLRSNPEAMDLLINEAMDAPNGAVAATFLGEKPPACLQGLPISNLRLAFLFDHLNKGETAGTIVSNLLHDVRFRTTDTWMQLGKFCLDAGNEVRAESFLTLYLSSSGGSNSKAWELLGDIYQSMDRSQEALAAYRKAVEVIRPPAGNRETSDHAALKVSQREALPTATAR